MDVALLLALVMDDCFTFYNVYFSSMVKQGRQLQSLLAGYVRNNMPDDDVFVGFGLGYDSEVPYYAERRALLLPDGMVSAELLKDVRRDPAQFVGQFRIGMVVVCPNEIANDPKTRGAYKALLGWLTAGSTPALVGYCKVYPTTQSGVGHGRVSSMGIGSGGLDGGLHLGRGSA